MKTFHNKRIIVSLTSFPEAIPYAVSAIRSVLHGSVKPDKMVLYLTASQFPDGNIPIELESLANEDPVFEVRFYKENIRSYTKLIPALEDFPNDIIVTVDDDIFYHKDMLHSLLYWHSQFPDVIFAHRAKRVKLNSPYRSWSKYRWYHFLMKKLHFEFANLQTGVGGVLYPPDSLKAEMLDSEIFMKLAPTVDDIWFWAAAVANGTKIAPVPFGRHNKPQGLGKPKKLSLKTANFKSGDDLNRAALECIIEKYPIIKQKIEIR